MARLGNRWNNVHIQESFNAGDEVQRDIPIAGGAADIRSLGHVIVDFAALYTTFNVDFSMFVLLRWGIWYGPSGACSLNQPAVEGDRWLTMGMRYLTTRLAALPSGSPTFTDDADTDHWSAEIKSMRTRTFGNSMWLSLQTPQRAPSGDVLTVRAYSRVLLFEQPA